MDAADSGKLSWLLAVSGGPSQVPRGFHPLAEEWHNVADREAAVGIVAGQPILISPGLVDYRLGDYFRDAYPSDRTSTAQTYAKELRTWFTFLATQDVEWFEAQHSHVRAFQIWRVYDGLNPKPVSPATWNKGWAALRHFYEWATKVGWVEHNPAGNADRLLDPGAVGGYREKNARASRDRWITPGEYAMWRDVGLRGYDAQRGGAGRILAGLPNVAARSRNTARNLAFVDYLVTTGLRLDEAGKLLVFEPGTRIQEEVPIVGKGRVRRHYRVMHDLGLASLHQYKVGERCDAIRRAQTAGRYEDVKGRLDVVEILPSRSGQRVRLADGRVLSVETMAERVRASLYLVKDQGFEPAWLWLKEDGSPLETPSWDKVFDTANDRVTAARTLLGAVSPTVKLTPHSLRFTFALFVLLAGIRAIDEHLGYDDASPFMVLNYAQAFDEVRDLLGHSSVETTKRVYLEPVKGLRRSSLLRGASVEQMWDHVSANNPLIGFHSS